MKLESINISINDDATMTVRLCGKNEKKKQESGGQCCHNNYEEKTVTARTPEELVSIIKGAMKGKSKGAVALASFIGEDKEEMED